MAPKHEFGRVLSRLREQRGFPTAHDFYAKRHGRENLRMTFRNYLNVEQGKSLPKPDKLQALIAALGLAEHGDEARELAQSYLSALGLDGVARYLETKAPAAVPERESELLAHAVRKALKPQMVHLTLDQWKAMADSYEAYVCDDMLQMTVGGLSRGELARQTGLSPAAVKRAVSILASAGLALAKGEQVKSAFEGKTIEALPSIPATVGISAKLLSHQKRLAEEARLVQNEIAKVRLSQAELEKLRRELDRFSEAAHIFDDTDPKPGSALYMVRAQLFRLFPPKS